MSADRAAIATETTAVTIAGAAIVVVATDADTVAASAASAYAEGSACTG